MVRKGCLCIGLFWLGLSGAAHAQTSFAGEDVQHYTFSIRLNDDDNVIKGQADVTIKFTKDIQSIQLNLVKQNSSGKGMLVSEVTAEGRKLQFSQDADVLTISQSAKTGTTQTFTISYSGIPADGLRIKNNIYGKRTFFGDNWPDHARDWLPCADYPADKATLDFIVNAPAHYQVISNGLKIEEKTIADGNKITHWKETVPLATKLMVIGATDFAVDSLHDKGIPVYSYVFPENKEAAFKTFAQAPEIMAYYEKQIGAFPFKKLANVQSTTIYEAMENAGAIFYKQQLFRGRYVEEVMAHEIAHQWFGDAVTEKSWLDLWLSEGFADYMTHCYLQYKYGGDTLNKRQIYTRKRVLAFDYDRQSPIVDTAIKGDYKQLLNADSYDKAAWVLHMLRRKIGDEAFWKGLRTYYAKYSGSNANTDDFRRVMEQVSGQDLQQFFKQWLFTAGYPKLNIAWHYDEAKKQVRLQVEQRQNVLYNLQLEYEINGKLYKAELKEKATSIDIPVATQPAAIRIDPNVNLLAWITVSTE